MSLSAVRAHIETRLAAAFEDYSVVYDNTFETPPPLPYVQCSISYQESNEPVIWPEESALEHLQGTIQLTCYAPRANGMRTLEDMTAIGMTALNRLYSPGDEVANVKVRSILGPEYILSAEELSQRPYVMSSTAAAFTAVVY